MTFERTFQTKINNTTTNENEIETAI